GYQNAALGAMAVQSLTKLSSEDLDHTVHGVYSLCESQQEVLQDFVAKSLNVARHTMAQTGDVNLNAEMVSWEAINQYSQKKSTVSLPKLQVGATWLGQITSA